MVFIFSEHIMIEWVVIGKHNTSLFPGHVVILNSDETSNEEDPELEQDPSVCEITPLLPNLPSMGVQDVTIQCSPDNTIAPAVAETTSPKLTSFLS